MAFVHDFYWGFVGGELLEKVSFTECSVFTCTMVAGCFPPRSCFYIIKPIFLISLRASCVNMISL